MRRVCKESRESCRVLTRCCLAGWCATSGRPLVEFAKTIRCAYPLKQVKAYTMILIRYITVEGDSDER
jgi:hypothetical protein